MAKPRIVSTTKRKRRNTPHSKRFATTSAHEVAKRLECAASPRFRFPLLAFHPIVWHPLPQPMPPGRNKTRNPKDSRLVKSTKPSPTEQRNPRSSNLDKMSCRDAIRLMLSEESKVPKQLLAESHRIEQVVQLIVRAFRLGGRLFYVGAGTSGRLGVLDASECPPTFRTPRNMVQGIIAGGKAALWRSVEGAEDNSAAGQQAIASNHVNRKDVVVGIAASGTTPYVWGALSEAKKRCATTVLLCFNPFLKIPRQLLPTILLTPNLGPEILTGSTRLKAGTATKLLLNIFTTLAMARLGKVMSNLMVDVNPSNTKLRHRAVRIVSELTKADHLSALGALEKAAWNVREAVAELKGR
ncbi:MAG: N-acetylmuramic acid 6-phosphate etherase [Verrucomicrobia bacterium]|nr:MAG: N-acetylmuramic acid 6-phosphate etherase [Verrucomicrobiota bacterium]